MPGFFGNKDDDDGEEKKTPTRQPKPKPEKGEDQEPQILEYIPPPPPETLELPTLKEDPKPAASSLGQRSVGVKVLNGQIIKRPDGEYWIVVTVDGPLEAYLVPTGDLEHNYKAVQQVDVSKYAKVYNFAAELMEMIPDLETVRRNVLMSIWRAGGYDKQSVKAAGVSSKLYQSAYPYRLPED